MPIKAPRHGRGHHADVAFHDKSSATPSTATDISYSPEAATCPVCGLKVGTRVRMWEKRFNNEHLWPFGDRDRVRVYRNHRVGTKRQGGTWPCPGAGQEVL